MALHSIKDWSIIFGSQEISKIAEEGISISFNGEGFTQTIGLKGEVAINQDSNESGTVTLNLLSTSESNNYLSGLYITAKEGGQVEYPLVIRDQNGSTLYTSTDAVIKRIPDSTKAKETGTNSWEIICGTLTGYEGGN